MPIQLPYHGDSQADPSRPSARASAPRKHFRRRGVSVVWLIIWVPVLLILSCLIIDVANVWLARVELENGLEAAALAAVKEWAESTSATANLDARRVGVAYACHNTVRGQPIVIGKNHSSAGGVNKNDQCCILPGVNPGDPPRGNLIFGAIVDTPEPVTFNAGVEPGCGDGTVLFDASEQGALTLDNAWGIAFRSANDPNLRITQIEIDLQASGGIGEFDLTAADSPGLSDNSPQAISGQDDIQGFTNPSSQITFSPTTGFWRTLTITFSADGLNDDGFAPGDRFRFGARVRNVSSGTGGNDGDGIGQDGVGVTVWFSDGSQATGKFFDNTDRQSDCHSPPLVEPTFPFSLIVNPSGVPDLPCPPASAASNNGQSYVMVQGGTGKQFAVRAQARVAVPTLWRSLFGSCIGPYCITVKTTAAYDCGMGRPKLIKLDKYTCPGP